MEIKDNPSSNQICLVDLLNIDLVKDKVFSYLNLQDLKLFSEVSKFTLKTVRNSKEYSKKATLVIGRDAVENDFEAVKALCSESTIWEGKKLRIDVAIPVESVQALDMEALLMNMESINFYLSDSAKGDCDVCYFLTFVLEKAEALQHLGLEPLILTKGIQDVISKADVSSNLKNLRTLQIQSFQSPPVQLKLESLEQALQMAYALETLNRLNFGLQNLEKLVFGKVHFNPSLFKKFVGVNSSCEGPYLKALSRIINYRSRAKLEELEIHHTCIWKEIENTHIPKLRRLSLSTSDPDGEANAQKFLANQGQLEHLDISVHEEFPVEIMRIIESKQSKLKSLRIQAKHFSGADQRSYEFLKRALSGDDSHDNLENIFSRLPSTVESVGLQEFVNFWGVTPLTKRNIWQRLSHLTNLTEVDLRGSRLAMNDEGLQDLILHCPQLTGLAFSHSEVTNFGVTGVDLNGRKTGVSLDQLKGLKSLSIEACPGIDKDQLFPVVNFKFLTRFHYNGVREAECGPVVDEALLIGESKCKDDVSQLLSQNPCLHELSLRLPFPDGFHYAEVKQLNGRLTISKHQFKIRYIYCLRKPAMTPMQH